MEKRVNKHKYRNAEKDQVQCLRSLNNDERSFVKFCNGTDSHVVLYWIDYEGQAVSFGTLIAGMAMDMDTYVTHPWIFVDEETGHRFKVKQKDVYFPEPHVNSQRLTRTLVFIMEPMFTLYELALRVIIKRLRDEYDSYRLEIPRVIQDEIASRLRVARSIRSLNSSRR